MNKKCKVVMLPANSKTNLLIHLNKLVDVSKPHQNVLLGYNKTPYIFQNIYVLSDDEIKEGDWYWNKIHNNVFQSIHKNQYFENEYKIIATTDSLKIECEGCKRHKTSDSIYTCSCIKLPSIPQSFIDKYVSEYNKGNKIEEVMVEYEEQQPYSDNEFVLDWYLKLNPDNTINIKSIKDSWNREEVKTLLLTYRNDLLVELSRLSGDTLKAKFTSDWIKKNL